jgi:hypothetical protein
MGLTCASLHVYSPDVSSGASAPSSGALVQAAGGRLGYDLIDNPEEAERQLVVAAAPPWVSVFDLTDAPVMTEESVAWGKQLSASGGGPVLLTSVVDSDAFAFVLFDNGKQVDAHASAPGVLPGRMKKWPMPKRTAEWSRLLNRPLEAAAVEALARKGELFADDVLLDLCDLVGLSRDLATRTPRDMQERPWPNQQTFNLRSRPGQPGGIVVKQNVPNKDRTQPLSIGLREGHSLPFELTGPAGAFADPVLEFTGPAVDTGLVELSEGYGLWALGLEAIRAGQIQRVHAEVSAAEAGGGRVLRACLKGLSAQSLALPPRKQSILIFWSTLRGAAAGAGELRVSLLPSAAAAERLELRPVFLVEV